MTADPLTPFMFGGTLKDYQRCGRGQYRVNVTMGAANTDTSITHSLGRTPQHYHQVRSSKGGSVYDGSSLGSDWTNSKIVLRSTVSSDVVTLVIY